MTPLGIGRSPGAGHQPVDVPVVPAVDGVGGPGGEHPADQGGHDQARARPATGGEHHRRQGGDQQQLDELRLGQRHVGGRPSPGPTASVAARSTGRSEIAVTGCPGARRRAGSRAPRGPSPLGMGCLRHPSPRPSGNCRAPLGFDHVDSARGAGRAVVEDAGAHAVRLPVALDRRDRGAHRRPPGVGGSPRPRAVRLRPTPREHRAPHDQRQQHREHRGRGPGRGRQRHPHRGRRASPPRPCPRASPTSTAAPSTPPACWPWTRCRRSATATPAPP